MDQLWKWIMHLNAKAFSLVATLLFFGIAIWCGIQYMTPVEPFKDGGEKTPELPPAWELGTLAFVSNQLAAEVLTIPTDPFRPTLEAIFTNETERTAFLKALKAAQTAAAGLSGGGADAAGGKKEDPFAHLRKKGAVPGGLVGPNGQPMVIPKLSFLGFFQRPDGKQAALFYDSVQNTTGFYEAGQQVHGVDVLSANVREAEIKFPDGTTRKLEIGGSVELAAEPAKIPPPKTSAAGAAAAAAKPAGKPGAPQKPVKPGLQQKPVKPGLQQKQAPQNAALKQQQKQAAQQRRAAQQKAVQK